MLFSTRATSCFHTSFHIRNLTLVSRSWSHYELDTDRMHSIDTEFDYRSLADFNAVARQHAYRLRLMCHWKNYSRILKQSYVRSLPLKNKKARKMIFQTNFLRENMKILVHLLKLWPLANPRTRILFPTRRSLETEKLTTCSGRVGEDLSAPVGSNFLWWDSKILFYLWSFALFAISYSSRRCSVIYKLFRFSQCSHRRESSVLNFSTRNFWAENRQ